MHNSGICKILSKQDISHLGYWEDPSEVEWIGAAANTVTPQEGRLNGKEKMEVHHFIHSFQ